MSASPSIWELLAPTPPGWGGVLLTGAVSTVLISLGAYLLGIGIGLLGATGKLKGSRPVVALLDIYTTAVRAIPELILIIGLYYAGTDGINRLLTAIGLPSIEINGFVAAVMVLGIVQGAYMTEVLRGAILSVPPGQIEAARAMGMPPLMLAWRVTLPQMLAAAIPGLANLWLIATKDTALLAVVGFSELTLVTRQAAGSTKSYLLFFCAAGVLYLMITLVSNVLIGLIERHYRRGMVRTA